jgi:hypothetical protein
MYVAGKPPLAFAPSTLWTQTLNMPVNPLAALVEPDNIDALRGVLVGRQDLVPSTTNLATAE